MSFDMERPAPVEDAGHSQAAKHESAATHSSAIDEGQENVVFVPGKLGLIQEHFYYNAPRQSIDLALTGAIAYMSGICGRAYATPSGAGVNQYILQLAATGSGKDAIASGRAKLDQAIRPTCPTIEDYKGPGQLVSAPGLIKWLDKRPCVLSILGEFGKKLKQMSAPNAPSHLVGLSGCLLEMYSKSGPGEEFDALAYSDTEKNTKVLRSPSLTIYAESVPESFYEAFDESMIADGLMPRFMVFEHNGERAYYNKQSANYVLREQTRQQVSDLVSHCSSLEARGQRQYVGWTAEAEALFDQFDRHTTDEIRGSNGEVARQLWNRVHLQAMKLASIAAIGDNYLSPVISVGHAQWAIDLVVAQTRNLLSRVQDGEFGDQSGNQTKQQRLVLWAMSDFLQNYEKLTKFFPHNRSYEYASQFIVPYAHISQRIAGYAAFKNDRFALKNAIKELMEMDFIREVPPVQMGTIFGGKGRGFVLADVHAVKQIVSRC